MARTLNEKTLRSMFEEESGEVFLALLEITEASLSAPLRAVNDTVDHTHQSKLYTAYPFEFVLPPSNDGLPTLTLRISNVSLKLIDIIRRMQAPVKIKLKIILASEIDVVKVEVEHMELKRVSANAQTIDFNVISPVFLSAKWPGHTYNKAHFPGLYK